MTKQNNKAEAPKAKKNKDFTWIRRSAFIMAFAAMLAIGAYFFVMVSTPDLSQKILGGFAILSSMYYFVQAIK